MKDDHIGALVLRVLVQLLQSNSPITVVSLWVSLRRRLRVCLAVAPTSAGLGRGGALRHDDLRVTTEFIKLSTIDRRSTEIHLLSRRAAPM